MAMNTIQGYYDAENASGYSPELPKVTQAIYNRTLLERAQPLLCYDKFGQQHPLKARSGKSMVFRRWEKLGENTTPLTEGVTPAGTELTKSEVVATIKQYGDYVTLTDMLVTTGFDPMVNESTELLGEQMAESMDTLYANKLSAGTNAFSCTVDYSGTEAVAAYSAHSQAGGVLHKLALDKAINVLQRESAKTFTPMVSGSDKDNTYPLAPAFWAVIHPDIERDLYMSTYSGLTKGTDFVPVEQYSNHTATMPGEIGKYRNIRFISTPHCKIWSAGGQSGSATYRGDGSNYDVYSVLIFARDAYGIVPLQKGSARTIVHRAGGPGDPLNQRNTVGWKHATTLEILNDAWMVRLECLSLL